MNRYAVYVIGSDGAYSSRKYGTYRSARMASNVACKLRRLSGVNAYVKEEK